MRIVDTSALALDQDTLRYIADDLWHELNGIELCYPQVLDDVDYNRMKAVFVQGSHIAPRQDQLETLYPELISCLGRISTQPSNIISLIAIRARAKRLADYLPKTFKDFVDKVTEARLQAEYYENAYEGAAEGLFMHEIEEGINAVVPRHREEVKGRIYEILMDHADEVEASEVENADMNKILELMAIKDDIDLITRCMDEGLTEISNLIIFIREGIDGETKGIDEVGFKLKGTSREEIEALDSGLRKLLHAMVSQAPSKYGSLKERVRAQRMEFASRIIMPPLKIAEDKRPSISEALRMGLTSMEAKVLLFLGYLKLPGEEDQLVHHDPASQDSETGRTLGEIERAAVAHRPIAANPLRNDN